MINVILQAVYAIGLRSVIHTWVLRMKGPVYVSMFKPLGMVIAIFLGVTILGDILHIGRYNSFVYFIIYVEQKRTNITTKIYF